MLADPGQTAGVSGGTGAPWSSDPAARNQGTHRAQCHQQQQLRLRPTLRLFRRGRDEPRAASASPASPSDGPQLRQSEASLNIFIDHTYIYTLEFRSAIGQVDPGFLRFDKKGRLVDQSALPKFEAFTVVELHDTRMYQFYSSSTNYIQRTAPHTLTHIKLSPSLAVLKPGTTIFTDLLA